MEKIDYRKLLAQGYEYIVIAAYDGPYGMKGRLLSKHKSYAAAEKAAHRKAPGESRNWLQIEEIRSYA